MHSSHVLFCRKAKLCFATISTEIISSDCSNSKLSSDAEITSSFKTNKEGETLLQVRKILCLKKHSGVNDCYKTGLLDTASSNHYVRKVHAEMMGFPCKKERMHVCTHGGDVKVI